MSSQIECAHRAPWTARDRKETVLRLSLNDYFKYVNLPFGCEGRRANPGGDILMGYSRRPFIGGQWRAGRQ